MKRRVVHEAALPALERRARGRLLVFAVMVVMLTGMAMAPAAVVGRQNARLFEQRLARGMGLGKSTLTTSRWSVHLLERWRGMTK